MLFLASWMVKLLSRDGCGRGQLASPSASLMLGRSEGKLGVVLACHLLVLGRSTW